MKKPVSRTTLPLRYCKEANLLEKSTLEITQRLSPVLGTEPIPASLRESRAVSATSSPSNHTFYSSMLTESFILSTLNPSKPTQASHSKDLGIHLHEYQPNPSLKSSLKKSSTQPNCLATSASHIFAAQSEKAVVHTYNRELGSLEAVVPLPEKIRSLAFAGDAEQDVGLLVLGTEAGGLVLWEVSRIPFRSLRI